MIEHTRNENEMITLKNKINLLHEKYETELETLRSENDTLRDHYREYQQNFKEFEKKVTDKNKIQELEKKVSVLNNLNEKLKIELKEVTVKYDKLKKLSSETTEELLKLNSENTKYKTDNKLLSQQKAELIEKIEKLTNEMNGKERTIRQLKLNEDALNHQFKNEKGKIESRFLSDKTSLNEKIELLEKEKDLSKDQIRNLTKDNKNLSDKLKQMSDYNYIKKEVLHLRDKVVNFENENTSIKLQNINLQKQIDKQIENLATECKKHESTKFEVFLYIFIHLN